MKNIEVISFADPGALAHAVASAWLDEIASANGEGKQHCVALSGGRITLKFFAAAIESARARGVSMANVHFFWADERCVPPTDPESNYAVANQHFFQPLGIAPDKIHRIRGELSPAGAAELAAAELAQVCPQLDLIFLGMGEDGHVASLFPGEPEALRTNPAVFRSVTDSPKPPPNRVTLGYRAIAAAKQVWVLASGTGKETALAESLSPRGDTPLARVLRSRPNTKVFTDIR